MSERRAILFYNPPWRPVHVFPDDQTTDDYFLTMDRRRMKDAVAVVFNLPKLKYHDVVPMLVQRSGSKKRGQVWVAWSMECDQNWRRQRSRSFMDLFDLSMSFRLDSDVSTPYIRAEFDRLLRKPAQQKEPGNIINAFVSSRSNHSGRVQYIEQLMKHLEVHSYGSLFQNRFPNDDKSRAFKRAVLTRYSFSLAFENSIAVDYVTEKFYQPLLTGSVPVYLGAPNVHDFAPGEHCFVNTADFESPAALAQYLINVSKDDDLYREYFEWKCKPFLPSFRKLLEQQQEPRFYRLCKKLDEVL